MSNPNVSKRQKERQRQDRQREKEQRRKERAAEKATRTTEPGVDPDIAGIVPGPQENPYGEESEEAS